jgi:hypothetical protein
MVIVAMAWLFVTLTMALTFSNGLAGMAFAVIVGLGPVVLATLLAMRRHRARKWSRLEQQVHPADDADAKPDQ